MKKTPAPRLVSVTDRRGDVLIAADRPAPIIDLQTVRRRPPDAPMATRERREPQDPAGFLPPVQIDAPRALMTAASLALVAGCILLALWLGGSL